MWEEVSSGICQPVSKGPGVPGAEEEYIIEVGMRNIHDEEYSRTCLWWSLHWQITSLVQLGH